MVTARRLHHIANGTSTTVTIEAAGIPGTTSIWADPLHEGPVPGGLPDAELVEIRRRFLAGVAGGAVPEADPSADPVHDLREWRAALDRHASYDELILWFEHDLFDQLNLIQLLTVVRERVPATLPVSLISIDSFPGRPDFKGLGELTPEELAPLLETRQHVGAAQFELARRAWAAFREPTPEGLDRVRRGDSSALPFLAASLVRLLEEYPWTTDGLSRTERHLLQLSDGDGISLAEAFPRMQEGEHAYSVTDLSLLGLAGSLARSSPPLLTMEEGGIRGRVRITAAGQEVLSGRLDKVDACGLDRWIGGVHLTAPGPHWRWNPETGPVHSGGPSSL